MKYLLNKKNTNLLKKLLLRNFVITRQNKIIILFLIDSIFAYLAFNIAMALLIDSFYPVKISDICVTVIIYQLIAIKLKNYKTINRFFENNDLDRYLVISLLYGFILSLFLFFYSFDRSLSFGLISSLILFLLLIISRKIYLYFLNFKKINLEIEKKENLIIYGSDYTISNIRNKINLNKYQILAFVDDDIDKQNMLISNIKIYSKEKIILYIETMDINIDYLLVTENEYKNIHNKNFFDYIRKKEIQIKIFNDSLYKNFDSNLDILSLVMDRDLAIPDRDLMDKSLRNKTLIITGAGGSIGSEIIRQSIIYNPYKIILIDNSEFALFKIYREIKDLYQNIEFIPLLESITDKRIENIFKKYKVDVIYHTAAYKHVGLVELNPLTAIYNNIIGLNNILNLSIKYNVKNFVLISTDKAVRPKNIMGLTKRVSELVVYNKSLNANSTKFDIVRFGNVAGSSGSVIEVFKKQLALGLPLTITHENATRYFMSIPEAAQLVIQSTSLDNKGGIFILDMGSPLRILDLAKAMLKNYSKNESNYVVIGLGNGEKINEELTINNLISDTSHPKIKIALNELVYIKDIDTEINIIKNKIEEESIDLDYIISYFKNLIYEFDIK